MSRLVARAEGRALLGVIVTSRRDSPAGATLYRGQLGVLRLDVVRTEPVAERPGRWSARATITEGTRAGEIAWRVERADTWSDLRDACAVAHARALRGEVYRARDARLEAPTLPAPDSGDSIASSIESYLAQVAPGASL